MNDEYRMDFDLKYLYEMMIEKKLPIEKPFYQWSKDQMLILGELFNLCHTDEVPF